ncbi:MAG: hypothetical protein M3O46_08375 [Myxococcota bacterium]|nr:hypothetical protein [Myxococcota bacterium]
MSTPSFSLGEPSRLEGSYPLDLGVQKSVARSIVTLTMLTPSIRIAVAYLVRSLVPRRVHHVRRMVDWGG